MKKIHWLFGLLLSICYSCSELDDFSVESTSESLSTPTTRYAGDEKYDVLGYGYDVTGEYLHPLSVRNPVLNIAKYEQEHFDRLQYNTSSYGFDQMYYGYSASDYTKDITKETKVTTNMSYGNEKVDTVPYFSGNITSNNYLRTEYAYSDKYSFASVDAVRNRKHIWINDEISLLSKYLSESFKADLERLSPSRIVERYGTHVLTDFIIGGRYKLVYRSVITHSKDATHKKKTVASGFKAALFGIGFSLNISRTIQTDESLVKDNQNKELFVQFYGGNGTSLRYDLEKGMPTGVDVQSWENSINLGNSCLNEIMWEETYPIYDFISDPVKKEEIKQAVIQYIENSKINELNLLPLYTYLLKGDISDHLVTTHPAIEEYWPEYEFDQIEGYILKKQLPGTIPLYEYYTDAGTNHYATVVSDFDKTYPFYEKKGIMGYVYQNTTMETVPLYEYFSDELNDHYASTIPNIPTLFPGWRRVNVGNNGYVYPPN
jgi:putative MAC/perforin domain protein